jgi:hypothetical protein
MSEGWIYVGGAVASMLGMAILFVSGAVAKLLSDMRELRVRLAMVKDRARFLEERANAAEARATEAETALTEIRMRRSLAVSKGNRRRAELERARIRETTEAVRVAVQRKKQPQGSLPL